MSWLFANNLNEASSGQLYLSGSGYGFVSDRKGAALSALSLSTSYLTYSVCPDAFSVYSFTMWIYLVSITQSATLFFSLNPFQYHIGINAAGAGWWFEGFLGLLQSTTGLNLGTWYYLAHTFTCFNTGCSVTLYTNGNVDGSRVLTSAMTTGSGACYISHPNWPLNGYIDNLFFYYTPLSQAQILVRLTTCCSWSLIRLTTWCKCWYKFGFNIFISVF